MGRWVGAIIAAILAIPSALSASPATATEGTPTVIPSVRYDGKGARSVSFSWDAPRSAGTSPVSDYIVEFKGAGSSWTVFDDGISIVRSATVTGLDAGRDYEFRVAAKNDAGVGPASTLGIGERFMASALGTCLMTPGGKFTCDNGSGSSYLAGVTVEDPNQILTPQVYRDVVTKVGYSQTTNRDLQCWLSKSQGVVCVTRFNEQGQQGLGYAGLPSGSFKVPGLPENIVDITVFGNTGCALSASSELWCWGQWSSDRWGRQLLSPALQFRGVKDIAGNCAIQWDQTVTCVNTRALTYSWVNNPALPTALDLDSSANGVCAISTERGVFCINSPTLTYSTVSYLSDIVELDYRNDHLCALNANGIVTCSGDNTWGQLGDGSFAAGPTTARIPEPVVHLASSDEISGTTRRSCAIGVSAKVYCWGNGVTTPQVVSSFGTWPTQSAQVPQQVTSVVQSARTAHTVTVGWRAPSAGDLPISEYIVEWRESSGTWNSTTVPASVTTWTSPEFPLVSYIDVRIAAVSDAGAGPVSEAIVASTTSPPQRPSRVTLTSNTNDSVTVEWNRAPDEDEPITGYQLEWTTDQDVWHMIDVAANVTQYTFSGLGIAAAIDVRIRAKNAAGISAVSSTNTFYTSGLGPRSFLVTDSWGQPAFGGRVTWKSPSGAFQSALDYGLTVDGLVAFPYMPAGELDVTLSEVQLPSGALANYSQKTIVGYVRPSAISIPAEPSRPIHTVTVKLPNGLPVVGAHVTVTNLYDYAKKGNAEFFTPPIVNEGVTNEFGEVYLTGYSAVGSQVDIEYNDGVLIQRLTGLLGTEDRTFTLEEMPWLATPVVAEEARAGSLVTVTVTATGLGVSRAGTSANAAKVTVVPPKGATQNCAGKSLSGAFGADGTATLRLCATKSGRYLLKGVGVVSTGAIDLKVKGAAPLPVSRARAFSPSHRTVSVSWEAPTYTGGYDVSKYTVTLSTKSKTITKTVKSTSVDFTGLNGTQRYTVTIVAATRAGSSEPVKLLVPVS